MTEPHRCERSASLPVPATPPAASSAHASGLAGVHDRVRVVLCDADGNLFGSEEPAFVASTQVTNDFLAAYGVARRYESEELRLATTGMNFRSTMLALALEHGIPVAADLAHPVDVPRWAGPPNTAMITRSVVDHWVAREKEVVTAYLRTVLGPDAAVLGPLAALARSYALAAVSSSADSRLAACFEVTGMAHHFPPERRFSAEDSLPRPTSKPDPAIYRYAGEMLGISGHEGLAVEDSVAGATSAVAAGFPTVGNLQFVAAAERAERRAALERAGVITVVTSWSQITADLAPPGARRSRPGRG